MESQVDQEADKALTMTKEIMKVYGFKYRYRLSTRDPKHPEKYLGDPKTWDKVEKWAVEIMERNEIEYYDGPGEAAFYAPKMDLMATDSLGREWQLSTLQIDFFLPERFNLTYIDKDSKEKRPVMLHRAILGSTERFLMILIEHFAGNFPTWLSPVQVQILPISEKVNDYSQKVFDILFKEGIRVELNKDGEPLGAKIRKAQMGKVPYMIIVGEKEEKDKKIAIRTRESKDLGQVDIIKFIKDLRLEIDEKRVNR
jgi:threonyl-tRNA synthetase